VTAPVQTILVIDDAEDVHDLVRVRLHAEGIQIRHALDPDSALAIAVDAPPDLILLDLDLPGKSGLEVCALLRADPRLAEIPVIFLTGTVDVATKVRAFEAGAVDYVTKPFDAIELRARVGAALRIKRYLDLLATRARLDGLTGLWNRAYFEDRLAEDLAAAARYQRDLALLVIDVDRFKSLNDRFGHPFGDLVLRKIAEAIAGGLRPGDVACRLGGDELAAILREADREAALASGQRIRAAIAALDLRHGDQRVEVTVSIGAAATHDGQADAATLMAAADRALYTAKRRGRNQVADARDGDDDSQTVTIDHELAARDERRVLAPGTQVGPYEVLELIGGGGMGTVYRAFDSRLLRPVALKVLSDPSFRRGWWRFEQEARALALLDHPGIVRVFDVGMSAHREPYLVLELLTGRTLRDRLLDGPVPLDDAIRLALALTRVLVVAHGKAIVHRDLKPENLFLVESGALKVLDFGLAKMLAPLVADAPTAATDAGLMVGTPGYTSPEQARGRPVDARTDLFAVGTILHELVTGRRLFLGDSPIETVHATLHDEPALLGVPALDAVLAGCLAKDPADRFGSARALEDALAALTR
jgi:two-component system cell cycle response regulator